MPAFELLFSSLPLEFDSLRLVRRLGGSSQSMLVMDGSERMWVLKPKTQLLGSNVLANELIGSGLCRSLSLPVPDYAVAKLSEANCAATGMWVRADQGVTPVRPGFHFVSRYMPDLLGSEVYESVPSTLKSAVRHRSECLGIFIFDVLMMHADRRQALFTCKADGLYPTFFDHSHLFGGPKRSIQEPFVDGSLLQQIALCSYQDVAWREAWITRMETIVPRALTMAIAETPKEWFDGDLMRLRDTLLIRLEHLRDLVEATVTRLQERLTSREDTDDIFISDDFGVLS